MSKFLFKNPDGTAQAYESEGLMEWLECHDENCTHSGCLEERALIEMTPEQLTLHLARAGISPADVEASLARALERMEP